MLKCLWKVLEWSIVNVSAGYPLPCDQVKVVVLREVNSSFTADLTAEKLCFCSNNNSIKIFLLVRAVIFPEK